ncbi:MAG: serine/threonine protein kinase [Planctomycetes bacterium]|nr:serine/threonine protein kinase [Planctomycetota bacterium]
MIGDRLGKWVIFQELGRGGMGRVYLAQEELTGKQAALKVLAANLAQEIGFLQRFQREIETLGRLDHPHIVRFFEAGCEEGLYFYAMEYVEGMSLEQIIEEQGRLPWRDVLDIALQVTPALRHVHDHGVIHRDIKPSNLLLDRDGKIKLTDFGIAKVFASSHLTATGGIVGTAEYISPEQAAGKVVGKRSDLYSLGCVLYALLTGRTPFSGNSYVELLHKHRYGQFDAPRKFVPDLPPELDELVSQMLEKDPDKRPPDALVVYKQMASIRAKLDRQNTKTSADNRDLSTVAENRTDRVGLDAIPGPATLMSRLVRAELSEQSRSGPVARFFNHPIVLMCLFFACIGVLAYGLWPLNQEQLFERGARLMASESLHDMQRAWTDYLGPLEARFPEHPYKEEVNAFRARWEDAKAPRPSEAQRFFQQGEILNQQGNIKAARQLWLNVIDAFGDVDAEAEWVQRARRSLSKLEKAAQHKDRFKSAHVALARAVELSRQGKRQEADRILTSLEHLYRDDATAEPILREVAKARKK